MCVYKTPFSAYAAYVYMKCVGVLIGNVFTDSISSYNLKLLNVFHLGKVTRLKKEKTLSLFVDSVAFVNVSNFFSTVKLDNYSILLRKY